MKTSSTWVQPHFGKHERHGKRTRAAVAVLLALGVALALQAGLVRVVAAPDAAVGSLLAERVKVRAAVPEVVGGGGGQVV